MKVTAFSGTFEMDANEKAFVYSQTDGLLKVSCTLEEAVRLMNIAEGAAEAQQNKAVMGQMAEALQEETSISAEALKADPDPQEVDKKPAPKKAPSKKRKPRQPKAAPLAAATADSKTSELGKPEEAPPDSDPAAESAPKVSYDLPSDATPALACPDLGDVVPTEVATATKLKTVVAYFLDNGTKDPAKIFELCDRWRSQVPVLDRATNLKHRVERICEALSL